MDKTYCAVVVGLCSHGLAISRSLHKQGIEVHALETNPYAPGFRTNSAEVHLVESINDSRLVAELLEFRSQIPDVQEIVLFPTNDNNVRIISENIETIREHFIVSWASSAATIGKLLLKSNIEQRCVETGLLYPKSVMANDIESLWETVSKLGSPMIVKPVRPQSGFKALKFDTQHSLIEGMRDYVADFPVLVQEWIAGTDDDLYFCAVYMDNGRPVHNLVGRKLDSYPPALGQTTVAVTHEDDNLVQLTHQFFSELGLSGPVSVEYKKDEQGNFWVIEPTVGRSDFWLGLCTAAGFDLPAMEYAFSTAPQRNTGPPIDNVKTIWFDSERDPAAPLRYVWKWVGLPSRRYRPTFSYFSLRDRSPFYRAIVQTITRLGSALFKKVLH